MRHLSQASTDARRVIAAYWLGRIDYRDCWNLQRSLVEAVRSGAHPGALLLLEHPHVFTVGRRGNGSTLIWDEEECGRRGVEVVWTDRGGDATYHGPGQLVGYPILNLRELSCDILSHIRLLEVSLIAYLSTLGLKTEPGGPQLTGVWSTVAGSQSEKVAAIGVKLNHQLVTSHGFALNLSCDLDIFNCGIVPCGLTGKRATSVLKLSGQRLGVRDAARGYLPHFEAAFGVSAKWVNASRLRDLPPAPTPQPLLAGPAHRPLQVLKQPSP